MIIQVATKIAKYNAKMIRKIFMEVKVQIQEKFLNKSLKITMITNIMKY